MLDTFEVAKDLLGIAVVLASSSGHVPSQCTKSVHDLGHRVDADVEQLADQFSIRCDDILVRHIGQRQRGEVSVNSHR